MTSSVAPLSGPARFDLSLRLWSDDTPLAPLADALGLDPEVLHVVGRPLAAAGRLSDRLAGRHYALLAHAGADDAAAVDGWLAATLERVAAEPDIAAALRRRRLEGVLWIAVLGDGPTDAPTLAPERVDAARAAGLEILVENYTAEEAGGDGPDKAWPTRSVP